MQLSDKILGEGAGSWWRFLAVCVLTAVGYLILTFMLISGIVWASEQGLVDRRVYYDLMGGEIETYLGLFVLFGSVALLHLVLALWIRVLYGRKYFSLINPLGRNWRKDAFWGLGFFLLASLVLGVLDLFFWNDPVGMNSDWRLGRWLLWLLPVAGIVLLQSSAEELAFRGFMQQYLARLTGMRWVYYLIPSALWALMHLGNYDGVWMRWCFVISTFLMGLILADWADLRGSLIGPIVIHFVNNFYAVCIVSNSLDPVPSSIWMMDLSAMSDQAIGIFSIISSLGMLAAYCPIRARLKSAQQAALQG